MTVSAEERRTEQRVEVSNLVKYYPIERGIVFRKQVGIVHAVDGVSFGLKRGTTLAIVGESGCGKSTVGRLLLGLEPPTSGSVVVDGVDLASLSPRELSASRRNLQIILQDPYTSLDPRMTVGAIIGEPFDIHPGAIPAGQTRSRPSGTSWTASASIPSSSIAIPTSSAAGNASASASLEPWPCVRR